MQVALRGRSKSDPATRQAPGRVCLASMRVRCAFCSRDGAGAWCFFCQVTLYFVCRRSQRRGRAAFRDVRWGVRGDLRWSGREGAPPACFICEWVEMVKYRRAPFAVALLTPTDGDERARRY